MLILLTNVDKKSIELLIAICHPTGDKWKSKTLFLAIFDPCLRLQPIRCGKVITFLAFIVNSMSSLIRFHSVCLKFHLIKSQIMQQK